MSSKSKKPLITRQQLRAARRALSAFPGWKVNIEEDRDEKVTRLYPREPESRTAFEPFLVRPGMREDAVTLGFRKAIEAAIQEMEGADGV